MRNYDKRRLLQYAFVSQNIYGSNDLLSSIIPFFLPIIEKLDGKIFDPKVFSQLIQETYFWSITKDIAEELIPRLENAGFLEKIISDDDESSYVYKTPDISVSNSENKININALLEEIINAFSKFVSLR